MNNFMGPKKSSQAALKQRKLLSFALCSSSTLIPKVKMQRTALANMASPTCHMALHTPSRALVSWYWWRGFTADVL